MKRTQNINHTRFRKRWSYSIAPIALAVGVSFVLSGCEQSDETVSLYQNADDCSKANPSMKEQCAVSYNNALKEAERTAPKYATREECASAFGDAQCTPSSTASNAAAPQQSSFWMPLMTGFMLGRMMGNSGSYMQQPLFSQRNGGGYVDASGKNYGATTGRTINVPRDTLSPKPTSTVTSGTTTTRGGFGETVSKLNGAQKQDAGNTNSGYNSTNQKTSASGAESGRSSSGSTPIRRSFGG
ncbi:DUF1190 family protein [Musicola keenii]|uniref:DUF1190 family protein n=1 Tax=Musicola keenii TaxID=2884250 RepID=UPI001785C304|nr:DUF1190 family protein [Musicola keenii]